MSDSVRPHSRQPTRLPRPWDSPGKNTGVGCHFLLQCMKVKSLSHIQLFVTPWIAAHQAPPSMGFSRQGYWSGVPLPVEHLHFLFGNMSVYFFSPFLGFHCGSTGKESSCNAGDLGLISGLERSPGEGKGYPLQHSGLENSMDCIVHGVSKSWTRLSNFYFHFTTQFTEYILNFSANPLFPLKQREETLCSSWLGFLLMQGGIVGKSQGSPSAVVNGSF